METEKQLTIVQKLAKASKEIKPVQKDGNNNFQNYRFQSEAAIKAAVKPALEKYELIIIPQYKVTGQRDVTGSKGRVNHIVDVLGHFIITDGRDKLEGYMPGTGMDTGEKATAKACTSAQKYFLKQLFNISDQEADPDETDSNINRQQQSYTRQPQQNYQRNNYNNYRRQ